MSKIKTKEWCVVHWLGGEVIRFGTEKDCRKYARKESFNPKCPIFYAFPVAGVIVHYHKQVEKKSKKK